jgi:hypothetical protein
MERSYNQDRGEEVEDLLFVRALAATARPEDERPLAEAVDKILASTKYELRIMKVAVDAELRRGKDGTSCVRSSAFHLDPNGILDYRFLGDYVEYPNGLCIHFLIIDQVL